MRLSKLLSSLVLTLLLPFVASSALAQPADPVLEEAQKLFRQGQHAQALSKVESHLGSKPRDPQGRFVKGLILTEMKRTGDAIAIFRKLTEDYPELPEPYNNLAVLYAQEKQYDKARQALEAAIKTHPSYAVAHENLGDIYAKLASQAYGKALQIDASNTTAHSKMALIRDLVPPTPGGKIAGKTPASEPVRLAAAAPKAPPPVAPAPVQAPVAAPVAATPPPVPNLAKPAGAAVSVTPLATPAAPQPKPAAPLATGGEADPARSLKAWVEAWSRKDVKAYLAAYAPDFQTPGNKGRSDWERERESRINKPGSIEVGIEKLAVEMNGSDKATVRFRQNYRSANLKTSANKTIVLVRHNGRWLIQQERVN